MTPARALMARLAPAAVIPLACIALAAHADDYPQGLIRKQFGEAAKRVEVKVSDIAPGQFQSVDYVGRPVYIYRRTAEDMAHTANAADEGLLADPRSEHLEASLQAAYASSASQVWARLLRIDQPLLEKLPSRSRSGEFLVVGGWSPHSGCALKLIPPARRPREWAVFGDTCLDAVFDSDGRILRGPLGGILGDRPAAFNLYIPPYSVEPSGKLVIGLARGRKLPKNGIPHAALYEKDNPAHNLIVAARYNDARAVRSALAAGADVNSYRPQDGSALDAAIIGSSIDVVKLLLARGAKPTPRSRTAAEFAGRTEVLELLGPAKN